MVRMIDNLGAPPELVRLAEEEAKQTDVIKTILFDGFLHEIFTGNNLGALEPVKGIVIVDMGACIMNNRWIKQGVRLVANAWLNLLYTLYHEVAHAIQLEANPWLAKEPFLPQRFEVDAAEEANTRLLEWAKENTVPSLNEMGWVGEQLKNILNNMYAIDPEAAILEIELDGTEAVAVAMHAILASGKYDDREDRKRLLESIDEGYVGVKVNGERYLTAYDVVDIPDANGPATVAG